MQAFAAPPTPPTQLQADAARSAIAKRLAERQARRPREISMGLERVAKILPLMGIPADAAGLRPAGVSVVVGGTNGKGSTSAFLGSIARAAGYNTVVYGSPHLCHFEERLTLNGEPVAAAEWLAALDQVDALEATALGPAASEGALTVFEAITLAALLICHRLQADVAIWEVGLGGRLDAVNVVGADASVLTSIDLDHMAYLGPTREDIGREKVAIAREGRPLVVGDPMPPQSVLDGAEALGADLWLSGRDFNFQGDRQQWSWAGRGQRRNALGFPALRGANQLLNASTALATLTALRQVIPVSMGAIRQGLATVELPGRFQVLPGQPAVVLDVAHNPQAVGVLAANLDQMGFYPNTVAVVGMLSDKDAEGSLRHLMPRVDHWVCTDLGPAQGVGTDRARTGRQLADTLGALQAALPDGGRPGMGPASITVQSDPMQALQAGASLCAAADRLVVFGSFALVGAVYHEARRLGKAPHAA